jgi:hypothetical protein
VQTAECQRYRPQVEEGGGKAKLLAVGEVSWWNQRGAHRPASQSESGRVVSVAGYVSLSESLCLSSSPRRRKPFRRYNFRAFFCFVLPQPSIFVQSCVIRNARRELLRHTRAVGGNFLRFRTRRKLKVANLPMKFEFPGCL